MAYIKSYRGQNYLLPPSLTDLFSKNHVAYLIEQITDDIDYSEFDENKNQSLYVIYSVRYGV